MAKKPIVIKVLKCFYDVFRMLIIVTAALLAVLYVCGIRPYVVQTGSMESTIPVGSVCFVNHRFDYHDVKKDDVIAFHIGDSTLVTHRAVAIAADGITTKGDANKTEDLAKVTEDTFAGKILFHIPKLGICFFYLKTFWGKVAFVTISAFLMLVGHILDNTAASMPDENQQEKEE